MLVNGTRRPKVRLLREAIKKSRNGCFACKQRKKKCDEVKPICTSCSRLNLKCRYGVKLSWLKQNQYSVSGDEFFNNTEISTTLDFINFTSWDLLVCYKIHGIDLTSYANLNGISLEKYELETKTDEEHRYEVNKLTSYIIPKSELHDLQTASHISYKINEHVLFNLYAEVLSRTKSFARSEYISNEFIHIVIPGCEKFPALYRAVLALSSLYLMKKELCKNDDIQDRYMITVYNSLFIKYKNDSLNYLHDILDGFDINAVEMLEELVITILILCSIEITNRGNKEWVRYLSEASLIFNSLTPDKIISSNIFKFVYKYFSLRYILLLTTMEDETINHFCQVTSWPIIDSLFQDNAIEPMYGCSPKLLHIIYTLTELNYLYEKKEIPMHNFVAKITRLWYKLDSIIQHEIQDCNELNISGKGYFNATKIYLFTILKRNNLENFLDDGFETFVPKLWEQLTELSLSKKSLFFPNWCLVIITTCDIFRDTDGKRIKTLQLFCSLQNNWPLSSVVPIRKAIECIWKVYDLSVIVGTDKKPEIPFDYRRVLKEYGYMLALT